MIEDVIKGDIALPTADISLINTRLDELEEKVAKMEQKLIDLQAITNIILEDISPTADNRATAAAEITENTTAEAREITAAEATEVAAAAEIAADKDTVPFPVKEETANEISKPAANKISNAAVNKLAARLSIPGNKCLTILYTIYFSVKDMII